jgi:threonylcarbamoyladenosine tRNA methylthiotransferase MtaB
METRSASDVTFTNQIHDSPSTIPVKYSVITFGCRVNQADSLAIEGDLLAGGATSAAPEYADLLIVNTCSVTSTADQGARQTIRRIVRANPDVQVVVTGCYATRRPDEIHELPNVVHVVRNQDKDTLVSDVLARDGRFVDGEGPCGAPLAPGIAGRTAFTLRVQTGCDERCSYCIIPSTRGTGRSRSLDDVIRQIANAVAAGYKEIAITGVHLGSYGRDLEIGVGGHLKGTSLDALVRVLAGWPDEVLFRISSLEPMDCTPAIVDLVASSPRLAPHFHLPMQHGSDAVLRAMRRPYTAAEYRCLIERIAQLMPHASIGTDLIVGFPGETDAQFEMTRSLVSDLPLSHVHVFPYSDRPGTDASRLRDKVDGVAIRRRGAALREVGARLARDFRVRQHGTVRRALTVDDGRSAVTDNYIKVALSQPQPRNSWVGVSL